MVEKYFAVHHLEDLENWRNGYVAKRARNITNGEKVLSEGVFNPFVGFGEKDQKDTYIIMMELTGNSQARIMNRVINPLRSASQQLGIDMVFPGYGDLPPHITLDTAKFANTQNDKKLSIKERMDQNRHLERTCRVLTNLQVDFDDIVISGRDTYLAVSQFLPNSIPFNKARVIFGRVMDQTFETQTESGLKKSGLYFDILHSSAGRITNLPQDKSVLLRYKEEVDKMRNNLNENPLSVTIKRAFQTLAYDDTVAKGGMINPNG